MSERPVITGGCLCGGVRYVADAAPQYAGYCFCADCRKASGSGFIPFMGFASRSVRITGQVATHTLRHGDGRQSDRNFCVECGGLVFGGILGQSEQHTIYAGSLDDPTHFKAHFWSSLLDFFHKGRHERIAGVAENADTARCRHQLGNQFKALGGQLGGSTGQTGQISVWARKAGDQPRRDGITGHHDDGNVARGVLCRIDGRGLDRDEDFDLAANQFRCQFGQAANLALCRANFDLNISSLGKAKLAERFAKWPHGFWAADEEDADAPQRRAVLSARDQWPRGSSTNKTQKSPPPHACPQVQGANIVAARRILREGIPRFRIV